MILRKIGEDYFLYEDGKQTGTTKDGKHFFRKLNKFNCDELFRNENLSEISVKLKTNVNPSLTKAIMNSTPYLHDYDFLEKE